MTWSLHEELHSLTGRRDVVAGLRVAGICNQSCSSCQLKVRKDWERAGAETYALLAEVIHDEGRSTLVYLKACVAIGGLQGVSSIVEEWVSRRRLLSSAGVAVPQLYGVVSGTIWEEFIPHALMDAMAQATSARRAVLADALGRTMGTLTRLGTPAFDTSDWRSRGTDVVLVDFGEDLGPVDLVKQRTPHILDDWLRLLRTKAMTLSSHELEILARSYDDALAQ